MSAARSVAAALGRARWRLVVPAALCAVVCTFLLAYAVVFAWNNALEMALTDPGGDAPWDEVGWFPRSMGAYGLPALHFLTTFLAASWVARRAGEWRVHGLLVGLLAAFYGQIVMLVLWPTASLPQVLAGWGLLALPFPRMALYLAVGLAGGFLGGASAWTILARREALSRASRDVGAARDPRDVSAAIGRHLAGPGTAGVALWEAHPSDVPSGSPPDKAPPDYGSIDVWLPRGSRGSRRWPSGERLGEGLALRLAATGECGPLVVRTSWLPEEERLAWREVGVRSMLLAPLLAPDGARTGLLMVASGRRWRAFSGGATRRYSTVAGQAALALENMRLLEEARRVGQEVGTLRERNRLAREIHDTLAQGFVSIVMNLEAADGDARPDELRTRDEKIERTARESLSEARRMVLALGPEELESATLPEALAALARRFCEETGVAAEAVTDGDPLPLPTGAEAALLRVAREALNNVRKHANADRAMLTLSYMGDRAVLDVRDDGAGFDPEGADGLGDDGLGDDVSGGFGLGGMRARIEEAGGTLRLESAPGEGTTVSAEMPVEASGVGSGSSDNGEGPRMEAWPSAASKETL